MTPKTWLTVTEGADHSGVCKDTIYTAVERGELRHVRIGGRRSIRLRAEWIDEWLERHVQDTRAERPQNKATVRRAESSVPVLTTSNS